jgi:Paraquat-inducible protein A
VGDAKKLFGIGSIAVLVLLFVVIMPILHLATLLAQWFFAWKIEQLRKLNRLSELLQVWQLAEVVLLSLVFSGIQLSSLSEFVIGKYCDSLDAGVQALEDAGLISANGETCYAATGSIEDGAFLLLVACVLVGAVRLFIVEAARQKLSSEHSEVAAKVGTAASGDASRQDKEALIRQMNPPKVLFADRFRWFLIPVVEGCDETRF